MTRYQVAELWGKIEETLESAVDAAKRQDWSRFDLHMENVAELRANLPIENARTVVFVSLKDTMGRTDSIKIQIGIEKHGIGLLIHPDGTGTFDGPYAPILLEQHEGTLLLIVWSDINEQEPTHLIDLSTANEGCRSNTD
jgi:hypothetical protein